MRYLILVLIAFPFESMAASNCADKAKIAAIESAKQSVLTDYLTENKMGSKKLQIELGTPRQQKTSKLPKGVKEAYWVPIKIQASKEVIERDHLFFFGKGCIRHIEAEYETGLEAHDKLKELKK